MFEYNFQKFLLTLEISKVGVTNNALPRYLNKRQKFLIIIFLELYLASINEIQLFSGKYIFFILYKYFLNFFLVLYKKS